MGWFITCILIVVIYYLLWKWRKRKNQIIINERIRKFIHQDYPAIEFSEVHEIKLAGAKHYKDSLRLLAGHRLLMIREPNNQYDIDAIKFTDLKGRQVGYVPTEGNRRLAKEMDDGEKYFGVVRKIKGGKSLDRRDVTILINKVKK